MIRYPLCKQRIPMEQESSLCDAVRLIVELFRHHFIEISQLLLFQDFRMEPCHAVDRVAGYDSEVCHFHLSVINNGHFGNLVLISRILLGNLRYEAAVDFLHDLVNSGEQP